MKLTKDAIYVIVILLLIALCGQFYYTYQYHPAAERQIKVYYNRDTEANQQVITTIQNADHYVHFAIYTFTREDIKDALLGARHRGLEVTGVVDREQTQKISDQMKIVHELQDAGVKIAVQDHSAIMHLKTVVTDKGYVSGSYNWTAAATAANDEVIEVGRDEAIREQYETVLEEIFNRYHPSTERL